jgi:hypothetical protein
MRFTDFSRKRNEPMPHENREIFQNARNTAKIAVLLIASIYASHAYAAQAEMKDGSLRTFLQKYLKGSDPAVDPTTRYSVATVSLDDRTQMNFVYISGDQWCGSGGCTALLLVANRSSFKVVQKFTLARLPILVLPTLTNGWHDIVLGVRGGGVPGHQAVLHYNGSKYPGNPSMAPASHPAEPPVAGTELPLSEDGDLLYP